MLRDKFVAAFGEAEALRIEAAAVSHEDGLFISAHEGQKAADPFQTVLVRCLTFDCLFNQGFRLYHQIVASSEALRAWIKAEADLKNYTGDFDLLAGFAGRYNDFICE